MGGYNTVLQLLMVAAAAARVESGSASLVYIQPGDANLTADQGNWTVDNCIIVKMAGQVTNTQFLPCH